MSRKSKAAEFVTEGVTSGFNTTVTGRNIHITDSMKDYAIEKISKIERFTHRVIDVCVTMDIQKLDHRVDIVMKVGHIIIKSHAASTDMYVSIDQAVDKLESQLVKYKKRIQEHHAKGIPAIDMNVNVIRKRSEEEIADINGEIEEENVHQLEQKYQFHEVVNSEKRPLKVLTTDEAIMKMELSGDAFLIFRAEDDRMLKVIYRRKDGNFGIIEPEC